MRSLLNPAGQGHYNLFCAGLQTPSGAWQRFRFRWFNFPALRRRAESRHTLRTPAGAGATGGGIRRAPDDGRPAQAPETEGCRRRRWGSGAAERARPAATRTAATTADRSGVGLMTLAGLVRASVFSRFVDDGSSCGWWVVLDLGCQAVGFRGGVGARPTLFFERRAPFVSQFSVTRGEPAETGLARHGAEVTPTGPGRLHLGNKTG